MAIFQVVTAKFHSCYLSTTQARCCLVAMVSEILISGQAGEIRILLQALLQFANPSEEVAL